MKIFRILTAIRVVLTTVGITAANGPGIPVATNAPPPVAIAVGKVRQQINTPSPPVLESEAVHFPVFWRQRSLVHDRTTEQSCSVMNWITMSHNQVTYGRFELFDPSAS